MPSVDVNRLLGILNLSKTIPKGDPAYQVIKDLITIAQTNAKDIATASSSLKGTIPTTVLHGAGSPLFRQVIEDDFGFTDVVTANSSTSKHGLLAKLTGAGSSVLNGNNAFVVRALYQATPSDPTGTTDTTGKMMGLAGTITPISTTRIAVLMSGNLTNSGATAGQGAKTQIRFGTGTAPSNGDALTGTAVGSLVSSTLERSTADLQGFSCHGIITGLTAGTAYWLDLGLAAITSGTGQAKNISITAFEL